MPGELNNPLVVDAEKEILHVCEEAGRSAGIHLVQPTEESIRRTISDGYTFIALGMDTVFLSQAGHQVLSQAKTATK